MSHRKWLGLAVILVAVLVAAGCARYKEELETAKQKVEQLTAETKLLKQKIAQLEHKEEKARKDLQRLDEECSKLRAEGKILTLRNERLSEETKKVQEANKELKKQVADLKEEKKDLSRKLEESKTKQIAQEPRPLTRPEPAERIPPKRLSEAGPVVEAGEQQIAGTPCEAMIQYMRKAGNVIRQLKGEERIRMLQQLKTTYAAKMQGAPKEAVTAARKWVEELSAAWDKTSKDALFKLLVHRNRALKACGKTPAEAGF